MPSTRAESVHQEISSKSTVAEDKEHQSLVSQVEEAQTELRSSLRLRKATRTTRYAEDAEAPANNGKRLLRSHPYKEVNARVVPAKSHSKAPTTLKNSLAKQRSIAAKLTTEAEALFKDVELWVQLTERINEKRTTLENDIHAAAGILTGSGGDAQALAGVPDDLAAAIEGCFADVTSQETLQTHLTTVREVTDKLVKSLPSPKKIPKAPSTQKPKIPRRTSKAKSKDSHGITEKRTYKIATSYSSSKDIPTPKGRHVYQVKGNQRPRPKPQGQNSTDFLPRSRNTVP